MAKKKGKKRGKKVEVPDGDMVKGSRVFESQCAQCHTVTACDDKNNAAPHLQGIVGRKSASTKFKFSGAMKKSKIVWDKPNLFQYLQAPGKFVPGNKMAFSGIKNPQERADLIAYLEDQI